MRIFNTSKTLMFTALLLLTALTINAQDYYWVEQAGGNGKDYGNTIAVDNEGNIFVGGEFSNTANFGDIEVTSLGNVDYFLAKYDSNHTAQWVKTGGEFLTDRIYGVALDDAGNIYTTGHFFGTAQIDTATFTSAGNLDLFTIKFNSEGEAEWVRQGTGSSQVSSRSIAVDSEGNVIVVGYFGSSSSTTVDFGNGVTVNSNGNRDGWIVKYDNAGNTLWATGMGGVSSGEEVNDVVVDADGNIYVTGMFNVSAVFGSVTLSSNGEDDIFIAKYSPSGDLVWVENAGGAHDDEGNTIALDSEGNIYVGGSVDSNGVFGTNEVLTAGGDDAFIAKYDNNGNNIWVIAGGSTGTDYVNDLSVDKDNNVLGTGQFSDTAEFGTTTFTSAGSYDVFTFKVSSDGEFIWAERAGGTDVDRGLASAVDNGGNLYTTGYFSLSADFSSFSFSSLGDDDIFISRTGEFTVPVELVSFTANSTSTGINLKWQTATETNNSRFEIERSSDKVSFEKIGTVNGQGTTTEPVFYNFNDNSQVAGVVYYRLKQVDYDGTYTYSNVVEVNSGAPSSYSLADNYPNPFNPSTKISYTIPEKGFVSVKVYDVLGKEVANLVNNVQDAGSYEINFNASNLSSGIYIYSLQSGDFTTTKKMMLMK